MTRLEMDIAWRLARPDCYRIAMRRFMMSAGVVAGGTAAGMGAGGFAWMNVALTAAWLAVAGQIARAHRKKTL